MMVRSIHWIIHWSSWHYVFNSWL